MQREALRTPAEIAAADAAFEDRQMRLRAIFERIKARKSAAE